VAVLYLIIKISLRVNPAQSWNRIGRALPLVVAQAADRLEFVIGVHKSYGINPSPKGISSPKRFLKPLQTEYPATGR